MFSNFDLVVDVYELRLLGLTEEEIEGYLDFFQVGQDASEES